MQDVTKFGWIPFEKPEEAAHHAHAAWIHGRTAAVLIVLWYGDKTQAGNGNWEAEVRCRGGFKEIYTMPVGCGLSEPALFRWADKAVARLDTYVQDDQGPLAKE